MLIEIGHVEAIFRYPVKSMGGERLEAAKLGWHGLDGDRRLDFLRRVPTPHFRRPSRQKRLRQFLPVAKNQCHLEANLVLLDAELLQAVLP